MYFSEMSRVWARMYEVSPNFIVYNIYQDRLLDSSDLEIVNRQESPSL